MYVDPSDGDFLSYAHLRSPILAKASATCAINFWYYAHIFTSAPFDGQLDLLLVSKDETKVGPRLCDKLTLI